jgi:NADH dehydrogenase FAD-containing subunit
VFRTNVSLSKFSYYWPPSIENCIKNYEEDILLRFRKLLSSKNVKLLTSSIASKVGKEMITFSDGKSIMAIFTAGIEPSELVEFLDLPKHQDWLQTDPHFRVRDEISPGGQSMDIGG